jgi:triacylglycerol esterase/lipase EstA (alpha/beta hydrolase family)
MKFLFSIQNSAFLKHCVLLSLFFIIQGNANAINNYPSHSGSSPVSYDDIAKPNGEFVISDRQGGILDNYMYRDGRTYQITIKLPIHRYVGDLATAVSKGVVSSTAKIYIPAYDVDAYTYPTFDCDGDGIVDTLQPEIDEVYFNGELIGTLDGDNNLWKFNDSFVVPIEKVKFPSTPGEVAYNEINIVIDAGNKDVVLSKGGKGCQVWATSVDWIGIKYDAAQPIYLMTGLFGSPKALTNSGYTDNIKSTLGLYSKVIDHGLASSSFSCDPLVLDAVSGHADEFIKQITEDGELIGTADIHLVGHSMGGLDGRVVLKKLSEQDYPVKVSEMDGAPVYENIKVQSLLTHGSPHKGSLVADYLPSIASLSSFVQDLCELKVETWKTANPALNQLNGAKFGAIGSDADWDNSGDLNASELANNQIPWLSLGNKLYNILYNYDELTIDYTMIPTPNGIVYVPDVQYMGNGPNPNDTMVTIESAHGAPGIISKISLTGANGKNHGTVIDKQSQDEAISQGKNALGWGALK